MKKKLVSRPRPRRDTNESPVPSETTGGKPEGQPNTGPDTPGRGYDPDETPPLSIPAVGKRDTTPAS